MTKEQAVSVLETLKNRFGVPYTLCWHGKTKNSFARPTLGEIHVGPQMWRGVDTLLHEYTHLLAPPVMAGKRGSHHGKHYRDKLWEVVSFWYNDASKYKWETEYTGVKAYGHKKLESFNKSVHLSSITPNGEKRENMYTIESGIQIPESASKRGKKEKYNFGKLEVGQMFFVPGEGYENVVKTVTHAAYGAQAKFKGLGDSRKFTVRPFTREGVEGAGVWRTAVPTGAESN